jgi:hypothetical protein
MVIAWPVSLSKISIQHLLPPIAGHGFEQPDIEWDTQFTVHWKGNRIVLGVEGHAQDLEGWKTLAHHPAEDGAIINEDVNSPGLNRIESCRGINEAKMSDPMLIEEVRR